MNVKSLFATAAVALAALPAQAVTVVQWDAETAVEPTASTSWTGIMPSTGTGTASGVHAGTSTWSTPVGNGSANSLSATNWAIGDYWQFNFSTVGYTGLVVSFDQTSSNTGPRDFSLSYSTDGIAFTPFQAYSILANAAPNAWSGTTYNPLHTYTFNMTALTSLDNLSSVTVRLSQTTTVSANGGVVASTGTNRVDNFTVALSPVPEPTSLALMLAGIATVGFIARRSRG